jgi:hypothetical protein
MKTIIRLIAMMVIACVTLLGQQKSDYATVQSFRSGAKSISTNIDQAKSVQECGEANASLEALTKEYEDVKALLDKAIYPDGYERTVERLRGQLLVRQKDLGFIESQIIRISELETQVRSLSDRVAKLTSDNEKLISDIQSLTQNVKKLTGELFNAATPLDSLRNMIVRLRQGLQDRDALIFALTDSLFLQYDKNIADMKDVEKQGLLGKIERFNVLSNVKRSIMDNVTFLESTQLKGNDLVTMVRQQRHFQSQWSGIGPKLAVVYLNGKTKKNEVAIVDSMISVWGDKVDGAMWRSLNVLIKEKGFTVKEFTYGEEFGMNFTAFLDEQTQNPNNESNDTRAKDFANFNENLWQTDLRPTWLPALVELQKISEAQKKDIEERVDSWKSSIHPIVSTPLMYILIALAAAIVALLAMRFFKKKPVVASEK